MNDRPVSEDDLWCDWCGRPNQERIYRHAGRVFCGIGCVRRYRTPQYTPDVVELAEHRR